MSEDTAYIGQTTLEPDQFMGPRRFKIFARCRRCSHEYSWITTTQTGKDRPCPKVACKVAIAAELQAREHANLAQIIESQRPPGVIGDKPVVKAVDTTAQIVMEDYGVTNLKDNLREGDTMAPSLPETGPSGLPMRAAAEGFFSGSALKASAQRRGATKNQAEMFRTQAINGAYRHMAVNPGVVLPGRQGEPGLRLVRTEK